MLQGRELRSLRARRGTSLLSRIPEDDVIASCGGAGCDRSAGNERRFPKSNGFTEIRRSAVVVVCCFLSRGKGLMQASRASHGPSDNRLYGVFICIYIKSKE